MVAGLRGLAFMLAVLASPHQQALVNATVASLPPCIREHINTQLHVVAVTSHFILGSEYDGLATPDGLIIVIDTDRNDFTVQLLHELGHEFELSTDLLTARLRRALRADFAALSHRDRNDLVYYRDPSEAAAELFAQRYAPRGLYPKRGEPKLSKLKRTRKLVNAMLARYEACPLRLTRSRYLPDVRSSPRRSSAHPGAGRSSAIRSWSTSTSSTRAATSPHSAAHKARVHARSAESPRARTLRAWQAIAILPYEISVDSQAGLRKPIRSLHGKRYAARSRD
jgi:hypothetical protein